MSSFKYNNVFIKDYHTIVGPKEKEGLINFKDSIKDYYNEEASLEDAEIKMQEHVLDKLIINNKLITSKIDLICGGDLTDQIAITNYTLTNRNLPFLGLYNACATFNEALIILSNFIENNMIENGIALTSSHNLNAERQFRFPIEYGFDKKMYATFTTTGAASCLLTNKKTNIKIESSTIGTIIDYGIKDATNMGAIMAPSAAHTLHKHLTELNRPINYYDLIITGDLGEYGSKLFISLIKQDYNYIPNAYLDAGSVLYNNRTEEISGGSGPVVVPLVLFNKIIKETNYKKILILATGSLHSPLMVNMKKSLPSITHAVSIEVIK